MWSLQWLLAAWQHQIHRAGIPNRRRHELYRPERHGVGGRRGRRHPPYPIPQLPERDALPRRKCGLRLLTGRPPPHQAHHLSRV
jgi:hypothetical protein